MKQFVAIILFFVCCISYVSAQTFLERLRTVNSSTGRVTVIQSKTIDELVNGRTYTPKSKQKKDSTLVSKVGKKIIPDSTKTDTTEVNANVKGPIRKVMGYRVQAFAGNNSRVSREKARSIGERLKTEFPEHAVYVHFYTPRWVCRMGNFQTREEAEEMLQKVKDLGYSTACLVKGKITVR